MSLQWHTECNRGRRSMPFALLLRARNRRLKRFFKRPYVHSRLKCIYYPLHASYSDTLCETRFHTSRIGSTLYNCKKKKLGGGFEKPHKSTSVEETNYPASAVSQMPHSSSPSFMALSPITKYSGMQKQQEKSRMQGDVQGEARWRYGQLLLWK